ncbi:hypothetical protein [Nonomuraea sp. NPDC049625]|uniref:hypothetical protein n=1 Tax=Nonomuraea sp. NPDC049625 TaxID=3155775 RepID=UPI00342A2500
MATDITALREARPGLAAALSAVRTELNAPAATVRTDDDALAPMEETELNAVAASVDRRMSLALRWEALVREVRALPGFETFLLPPTAGHLRSAARGGPVVMLNVSSIRCDALIPARSVADRLSGGRGSGCGWPRACRAPE